ncbi:hypothetical protein KR018_006594, partial [Drosophila ironensis]
LASSKMLAIILLLLLQNHKVEAENPQNRYFNKLIQLVEHQYGLDTLLLYQGERDCPLRDWYPRKFPILRFTELTDFGFKKQYNQQALALACITNRTHSQTLETIAKTFDCMREERVILTIQGKLPQGLLNNVSQKAVDLQFTQLLVINFQDDTTSIFRLKYSPTPHFKNISNIFLLEGNLFYKQVTYYHRIGYVYGKGMSSLHSPGAMILSEFAKKINLTLNLLVTPLNNKSIEYMDINSTSNYDLTTRMGLYNSKNIFHKMDIVNPAYASSLQIVVPCKSQLSAKDLIGRKGVKNLVCAGIIFYITFGIVNAVFVGISNRFRGTIITRIYVDSLWNLRAFSALLSMPFSIPARSRTSQRQLLLTMSLFGSILASFFCCQLNALLIKRLHYPQVNDFTELRDSGLTVVVDLFTRKYIEDEIDREFFKNEVPNVMTVSPNEFNDLIMSLNTSFAYLVHSAPWRAFSDGQVQSETKIICEANNLTIIENVPVVLYMQGNSIYNSLMRDFIMLTFDTGLLHRWILLGYRRLREKVASALEDFYGEALRPLCLRHFKWLWALLIVSYFISLVVFLIELYLGRRRYRVEMRDTF